MEKLSYQTHSFAEFTLDLRRGCLQRDQEKIKLRPKSFEVLKYLIENNGRLISKDELIHAVWVDTAVTDDSLVQCLKDIRHALRDEAQQIIKTVPRRGYIFDREVTDNGAAAPVTTYREETAGVQVIIEAEEALSRNAIAAPRHSRIGDLIAAINQHRWAVVLVLLTLAVAAAASVYFTRPGAAIDSVAVMPFQSESSNADTEYLSDGISEALINSLAELPQLRVTGRPTTLRYKGKEIDPQKVGRELNVGAVLTGTFRQANDSMTIQVDLIDTASGAQLWGKEYERKVPDILAVKQAIAREVTEKLRLRLSGGEQQRLVRRDTTNADSYGAYLKGRYFWNKRTTADLKTAIEYFNQAIAQDPNYAMAYVGLSDCYHSLPTYSNLPPEDTWLKARMAAARALEIDETLAEAHASLAVIKFEYEWDFAGAEREYKRAIEINPNYASAHQWYGEFLGNMGRHKEAIAEANRALELDPLSLIIKVVLGAILSRAGQYDLAEEQLRNTIDMDKNFGQAHMILSNNYIRKGMYLEAIDEFEKGKILLGADQQTLTRKSAALKAAYQKSGARGYWQERLNMTLEFNQQGRVSPYYVGMCYAQLGRNDQAFMWLEKAYERRDGTINHLKAEPEYDVLHSDPRFQALLRRVGLPN